MTEDNLIQTVLDDALVHAKSHNEGKLANYIPELAAAPKDLTGAAIRLNDGRLFTAGDTNTRVTLQSVAKLVVLIGLLEEAGWEKVSSWVHFEPSGDDFASIVRLDQTDPIPFNPMLNSGAISLCSHIPGAFERRLLWLEKWMKRLFGKKLAINEKVFSSERRTGDKNRSLAYLLKSKNVIAGNVKSILETYFCLCSFETNVVDASYLSRVLASGGLNENNDRLISRHTCQQVLAVMATCGLYNESGEYLLKTGMPAKSGVSGFIVAVAIGKGGIAVVSPRINQKGSSVRGRFILEYISRNLDWHFSV